MATALLLADAARATAAPPPTAAAGPKSEPTRPVTKSVTALALV